MTVMGGNYGRLYVNRDLLDVAMFSRPKGGPRFC
jgi:hypothetical protein